jgi:hypothetical protein
MEEEDHFTQTQLPALIAVFAAAAMVNGCCTLMATNPTITLFAIHVGQLSSCFFSTGLHPAALPSLPF